EKEEQRDALASRLGLPGSFEGWVQEAPAPLRSTLKGQGDRLRTLTDLLAAQAVVNERLLQAELAYVEFALSVLAGPRAQDFVYGPSGAADGTSTRHVGGPRHDGAAEASLFEFKV